MSSYRDPSYRQRFWNTSYMGRHPEEVACGRPEDVKNMFSVCYHPREPLGHDRCGAGFNFGTRFIGKPRHAIATKNPRTPTYEEPDNEPEPEIDDYEPEPEYQSDWVEIDYPVKFEPDYEELPRNPPLKDLPRRKVASAGRPVHGPFVVRMAPQRPCYHCETGPKTYGKIPPWRAFAN